METRKSLAWIGAAALVATLFMMSMGKDEDATPKPVAEPDLFSFVRPGVGTAPDGSIKAATNAVMAGPHDKPPGTAHQQEKLYAAEESVQKMRAQGASEDEIYRLRAAALSAETAARLAERDNAESAWRTRVSAYLAERNRLLGSAGTNQMQALQQLRDARFTVEEQGLLAAYESSSIPELRLH